MAGLPIEVVRTYDSRDTRVGDFGIGWNVGVRDVRLQKNVTIGRFWEQTRSSGPFPNYCVRPTKPHTVTVTFQLCPCSGSSVPSYRTSWCAAAKWRVVVMSKGMGRGYRERQEPACRPGRSR